VWIRVLAYILGAYILGVLSILVIRYIIRKIRGKQKCLCETEAHTDEVGLGTMALNNEVGDEETPVSQIKNALNEQRDCSLLLEDISVTIHRWPYKRHKLLLMISARLLAKTLMTTDSRRPDVWTFSVLASVCRCFHEILIKLEFIRSFQQYLTAVCCHYRLCLSQLKTFCGPRNHRVQGLATLDNKLFIVYMWSNTIFVYNTQQSNICISGLKSPVDIAACSINSCLYVADMDGSVWMVKTRGKVSKWQECIEGVQSLSVTSEGQIVMSVSVLSGPGRVDIYNSNGVKQAFFYLPTDVIAPQHVVQTVNKSFIVCHGRGTGPHQVCEVNDKGVKVKSYGESRGSKFGQLDAPKYIALGGEEQVFVADSDNHRVLLFDTQLNMPRVLLTCSDGLCPWRVFYNRETTQLVVGFTSGQVDIFGCN
jgi:hypothetical protein